MNKKLLMIIVLGLSVFIVSGCASASQKEMLDMLNRQESITIEVAEPISQEQGTEIPMAWTELALLDTYESFRMTVDDALGITAHGNNGKNGVLYVDLDGNQTNNSTLYNAFANQRFRDNVWNNTDINQTIIKAAQSIYTDVESDKAALLAGYNAYYNLLADSEPGYANMNSTLTRLEAMAFIFKADTPVQELQVNEAFAQAVENEELAIYAQDLNDQSYLKADNLSLDSNTANSTITRAEFVYMLVNRYFSAEYEATTGKESCFSDCKNAGDIASKVGIITTDKKTGITTTPNRWQSYELSYSIQNESKGLTDALYRAMVVAQQKGLITGTESRWSDGLTKGEALNMITKAFMRLDTLTNADRGASSGEIVTAIDFKDIDPEIHATHDETTGTITVDDTMTETMRSKCPYFQSYIMPKAVAQSILAEYLDGYYKGRFDDNAWLQFALTGDQEYLNLEVTDSDLLIQNEQQVDEWLQTEEGQKTKAEVDAAKGTEEEQQERLYNTLAETMGLSVEEVKALMAESESSSNTSTSSGNTGGGSSQIATPSTDQSAANENTFVTPENNDNINNNSGSDARPGEITVDIWGNAAAAGDGGPLTGNVQLNP